MSLVEEIDQWLNEPRARPNPGEVIDVDFFRDMVARRMAAEAVAEREDISFRKALNAIRKVESKSAEELAAASGVDIAVFAKGLFSEEAIYACCVAGGAVIPVSATVGAFGDGTFLKWLFSKEGQAAFFAFVKKLIEIIMMIIPLFL